jgi:RNA polymerase sigma-70 factor (ECF subfamily)
MPDSLVTDPQALLDKARTGSETALGDLLASFSRYLTLLARVQIGRRLQGKVDADDLVQETFLEVHRQIANFRGTTQAEFLAWVRKILAGQLALTIRRYLGTKGRDATLERELAVQLDQSSEVLDRGLVASQSTPSQQVSRREQGVLLAESLDKLPKDYREVIILRHLEDLPLVEVARRMDRTEDSVQKLWVRALVNLRKQMVGQQ